jgi:hypothetical protein
VAHTCNYKYSGSRDQEDHGSKPAQVTVHEPLSQKNPSQKRADDVAPSSEFKPQYHKKTNKQKPHKLYHIIPMLKILQYLPIMLIIK